MTPLEEAGLVTTTEQDELDDMLKASWSSSGLCLAYRRLMVKILHFLKDPKLSEFWHIPFYAAKQDFDHQPYKHALQPCTSDLHRGQQALVINPQVDRVSLEDCMIDACSGGSRCEHRMITLLYYYKK